jgi:hypothetical protein
MNLASYISGFVDGEGCFCVSFQPSDRHRYGWEVRPSFSVSQNVDRAQLLNILLETWKCGSIRPDRSDKTVKFEVRKIDDLVRVVIPHFEEFPLLSTKSDDVLCFSKICRLIKAKQHLELNGFREIVKLAMCMNPTGKRKYRKDEILSSLCSGEGIVCAT